MNFFFLMFVLLRCCSNEHFCRLIFHFIPPFSSSIDKIANYFFHYFKCLQETVWSNSVHHLQLIGGLQISFIGLKFI